MRYSILPIFLAALCAAPPAAAEREVDVAARRMVEEACAARPVQWHCMGEMRVGEGLLQPSLRVRGYQNHEQLLEMSHVFTTLRQLNTRNGAFFDGFSERQVPLKNPLWGSSFAFATPLGALMAAFPDGPDSVPERAITQETQSIFGKVSLTAWRLPDGEVRFKVRSENKTTVSGMYRAGLLEPLPGDFSLSGWRRPEPRGRQEALPEFERLEQAR